MPQLKIKCTGDWLEAMRTVLEKEQYNFWETEEDAEVIITIIYQEPMQLFELGALAAGEIIKKNGKLNLV